MTPEEIKRAAYLLQARSDLCWELATDHDQETIDKATENHKSERAKPLFLMKDTVKIELDLAGGGDDDGSLYTLAKLEIPAIRKAMRVIVEDMEAELIAMGVELTP